MLFSNGARSSEALVEVSDVLFFYIALRELERSNEALRVSNVPKNKFAFKRRPAVAVAATNFT